MKKTVTKKTFLRFPVRSLARFSAIILGALCIALPLSTSSCHEVEEWDNNSVGNFDALWKLIDEHYCFFEEKGVDWNAVYKEFRPQVDNRVRREQLFDICSRMLDRLQDGHVNLSSPFATSYYKKWWTDYPQNYDARLVEQYYFDFQYHQLGGISYGILPGNVGYMRYPSFEYTLGEGNLDNILYYLRFCTALIIDVRDNGGGYMTAAEDLISRFVRTRTLAGYIRHKTGPGHNDFSEPYAFYYDPPKGNHLGWLKPAVVLCNRSTFSAANHFVAVMKQLPAVRIVGDVTGGGAGMPLSLEIPCGWGIRMSACPVTDANGNLYEFGVEPSEGCKVDLDPLEALNGKDTMLERAIQVANSATTWE